MYNYNDYHRRRVEHSFRRAQRAWENRLPPEYDEDNEACEGPYDGCEGCEGCTKTVETSRYVVARKARGNLLPGDLVYVTRGFRYQINGGPRLGYYGSERLVGYGPGHGPEKMGRGWGHRRGGFAAHHPQHAGAVSERDAHEQAEHKAALAQEAAERKAAGEARTAAHRVICNAKVGDKVAYQGETWVAGNHFSKMIMHSNLEYAGGAGDCSVVGARKLTNARTGQVIDYLT